jgi:hypothetical protein
MQFFLQCFIQKSLCGGKIIFLKPANHSTAPNDSSAGDQRRYSLNMDKIQKPKSFRLSKNFQPLTVEEDDELFPNGIFEFNITKLLAFIRSNPDKFVPTEVDISTLSWSSDGLNESAVRTAVLSAPIILAEISPGKFNVIDGHHRLERAHRDGVEKLSAFRVHADQHFPFLTSEKAYRSYVEYWNSKVDDAKC